MPSNHYPFPMKNSFRLLIIVCLLAGTGEASGQMSPGALLLDSVYSYNWVSNSWSLNIKNYCLKNGSGKTTQSLFKKYNTGTGLFLDYVRFLYTYSGTASVPTTITDQFWYSGNWNTYQYTHYQARDIPDTTYYKDWDNQHHKFISGLKNTYQYNDSLLPLENITQDWDTTTQDWLNTTKKTYSYTAAMKPSEQILLSWQNSSSTWKNSYKYSDVYDLNDLLINHFEYEWNDTASNWINTSRITYFNNPASQPYLVVEELWDSYLLRWDSLVQTSYIYNQFNWLMTIHTQIYQKDQGKWVESYLTYFTYFPSGDQRSMTGNVWDITHLTWATDAYQEMDSITRKLAESYHLTLDPVTFLTLGGIRNLYTYQSTGDTLSHIYQEWDVPGNDWANKTQVVYTYESHNLLSEELNQSWTSASSSWVNTKKSDYFYSEFIGIGEHPVKEKPCFYANPMAAGNSIYCPDFRPGNKYTLRVCSLSGSEVYRTAFTGGESVMISESLASGLYFLIIEENNRILYKDKVVLVH
jgi:hypothetical protein